MRAIDAPFVAPGPAGVAIRDRLKHLTPEDDTVLRLVGEHLGRLASLDLKARRIDGADHSPGTWAARKQGLTAESSSRWAGSITKATHDQWALCRRCRLAHIQGLQAGVGILMHRLSRPIGEKGTKQAPGGYRSKGEWFHKSRRLAALQRRLDVARDEREAHVVHVVRGGRQLLNNRHNLQAARLTEPQWRERWEAARWFLSADGESGKHLGNEKTREKHGRKKRLRQIISGIPTGRLKARLVSMAAERDLAIVAVDPAYTSMWGDEHWRKPLTSGKRKMSRHDAAGIAIGRRALGHPIRRRAAPPRDDQSDRRGHRTAQARPGDREREGTRPLVTEPAHDARRRTRTQRTRETSASNTVRDARGSGSRHQMPLLDTA
ncbi:hypothetical protein ACFYSC_29640 [Streptosporangium sp. NPDC004379]|uniref:hypothetical protein n=1 Tax=Streptosporangium sp. NPDC004379 TaxID=3366189 RepID=UPI003676AA90